MRWIDEGEPDAHKDVPEKEQRLHQGRDQSLVASARRRGEQRLRRRRQDLLFGLEDTPRDLSIVVDRPPCR